MLTLTSRKIVFYCLVGYLLLISSTAHACSCANGPISNDAKNFNAILLIEVLNESFDFPYLSESDSEWIKKHPEEERKLKRQNVTVSVKKLWKGKRTKTLKYSATDYGTCEMFLEVGKQYLFYGGQKDDQIGTSICSRTAILKNKEVEMSFLDRAVRGDSPEKLQEYLLEIVMSDKEERIRIQALSLLKEEWNFLKHLLDMTKSAKAERTRKHATNLLPKGWREEKFYKLVKEAWERVSKDPDPEIRKESIPLMRLLNLPKEEENHWLHTYLKDDSARVRSAATSGLKRFIRIEKKKEETLSLLKKVITHEKEIPPPEDPKDREAQRYMIQGTLFTMIGYSNDEKAKPWMFPYILKDLSSEFPQVQKFALYNLGRYKTLSNEQKKQVVTALRMAFKSSKSKYSDLDSKTGDPRSKRLQMDMLQEIISALIKYGGPKEIERLLPDILNFLGTEDLIIKLSALNTLSSFKVVEDHQKREIRSVVFSEIEKEKELAVTDPNRRELHRQLVQKMISFLIDQHNPKNIRQQVPESLLGFDFTEYLITYFYRKDVYDDIQPLTPEILLDFEDDYQQVSWQAYSNLQKLKPLEDDLLDQLEETLQRADSRSKPRIRKWINQLKKID